MQGIETRLNLTNSDKAELTQLCFSFQTIAQSAYQALKKSSTLDIRSFAKDKGLTNHQSQSVETQVNLWFAQDKAEYEEHIKRLELSQKGLKKNLSKLNKALENSLKKEGSLEQKIKEKREEEAEPPEKQARKASKNKSSRKTQKKTSNSSKTLKELQFNLRNIKAKLEVLKSSTFQKHRKYCNREEQLKNLKAELESGDIHHRCFGSKNLFRQGQQLDREDSPFQTQKDFEQEFVRRKYHHLTLVGAARHTSGNQSAQIHLENNTLEIRLTEEQAQKRLKIEADRLGISVEKVSNKLSFKRLIVPCAFNPKRQKLLEEALKLKLPITVQITEQATPKGERDLSKGKVSRGQEDTAFYVHLGFDLPPKPIQFSRHLGVLGIDVNCWGLAWSIVKPDGNIQKDVIRRPSSATREMSAQHLKGNIEIDTRPHRTAYQIQYDLEQAIVQLCNLAEQYKVAIAIEDLDFTSARSQSKEKGPGYARMIHKLQHAGIKEAFRSRCRKQGIALHLVNPAWTSIGGFIKYGFLNGFSVDQAASFMIARRALFGKHWVPFEIKEFSKKGKPYTEFQRKQIQKRQQEILQNQVLYHVESAYNPAVPVPLTRWICENRMNNPISKDEMGSKASVSKQGQTKYALSLEKTKVTWRDWSKVLGSDRGKWVEIMMQDKLKESRTTKAAKPLERKSLSSEKTKRQLGA